MERIDVPLIHAQWLNSVMIIGPMWEILFVKLYGTPLVGQTAPIYNSPNENPHFGTTTNWVSPVPFRATASKMITQTAAQATLAMRFSFMVTGMFMAVCDLASSR